MSKNIYIKTDSDGGETYGYFLTVMGRRVEEFGFKAFDEAAWACDKARLHLSRYIRRHSSYHFPLRIQNISEHELSTVSPSVLDALSFFQSRFPDMAQSEPPLVKPNVEKPERPTVEETRRRRDALEATQRDHSRAALALVDVKAGLRTVDLFLTPMGLNSTRRQTAVASFIIRYVDPQIEALKIQAREITRQLTELDKLNGAPVATNTESVSNTNITTAPNEKAID